MGVRPLKGATEAIAEGPSRLASLQTQRPVGAAHKKNNRVLKINDL
jgi:hypothetical protein